MKNLILILLLASCASTKIYLGPNITKLAQIKLSENNLGKSPSFVVIPDKKVFATWARFIPEEKKEIIEIAQVDLAKNKVNPLTTLTSTELSWNPSLIASESNEIWAIWEGRTKLSKILSRNIYVQKVFPLLGKRIALTRRGMNQNYQYALKGNTLHLVFERSINPNVKHNKIVHTTLNLSNPVRRHLKTLSTEGMNRRPTIALDNKKIYVAWDKWNPLSKDENKLDPNFDIHFTEFFKGNWSNEQIVDGQDGIQAAPHLAINKNDLYLSYHTSTGHPLLKTWQVLKRENKNWKIISTKRAEAKDPHHETNLGSEFVKTYFTKEGHLVLLSRPSHGFKIHLIGQSEQDIEATEQGWGARGLRHSFSHYKDNTYLVARRGRKFNFLELYEIKDLKNESPNFIPFTPPRAIKTKDHVSRLKSPLKKMLLLFGDVHTHSALSDGTGPGDEIYARAYERGHDFAMLTDHDNIVGSRLFPSEYDEITWMTDYFNQFKNFTTLHAYEWTTPSLPNGFGHRNIYFKDHAHNPVYSYKGEHETTKKLFDALKDENAFAVPHHTGWTGTDWENADEKIQRHVEITSVHGAFEDAVDNPFKTRESMPGMFVRDGLKRKLKFGFVAGSDGHGLPHHHGTARHEDPWSHGLTGVFTRKNSRHSIWHSMYDRHTISTSGPRVYIYSLFDKSTQGDEYLTKTIPTLKYEIKSLLPIKEFAIIVNGEVKEKWPIANKLALKGKWLPPSLKLGANSVYIRIIMESSKGDEMAWSSPHFVNLLAK